MLSSIKTFTGVILSIAIAISGSTVAISKENPDNLFYNKLYSIYQQSKKSNQYKDAEIYFSPSISKVDRANYLEAIERSLGFWHNEVDFGTTNFLVWDPKDLQWANKKYSSLTEGWDTSKTELSSDIQTINGKSACLRSTNGTRYFQDTVSHMTVICHGKDKSPWISHVISHEITHIWQMSVVRSEQTIKVPLWLSEGSAIYYGLALNGINQKNARQNFKQMYSDYAKWDKYGKSLYQQIKKSPKSLCKFLNNSSTLNGDFSRDTLNASYHYGSLVVAQIVQKYGHDKFIEYFRLFNTSSNYSNNFKSVFGISIDSFCGTIAKDILRYLK